MELFVSEIVSRMDGQIKQLEQGKDLPVYYRQCKTILHSGIGEINGYMRDCPFAGKTEEIRYFKELLPPIYGRLLYFMKLHQVESCRAYYDREKMSDLLKRELAGIRLFYEQHADICQYYHQQASYWDDHLFTREGRKQWTDEGIGLFIGPDFTLGSYWVAWILTNGLYRLWLEENLSALDRGPAGGDDIGSQPFLPWKESNAALVEFIYGVHEVGSFGDATLKNVVEQFEKFFRTELSYHAGTFQQIAQRKLNPTKYIDCVRDGLIKKINKMN